jgi:hypothetical protein
MSTVADVARVLNLKERRVQQLAQEGIIPKPEHGKYNLAGCIMAYNKYRDKTAKHEEINFKARKAKARLFEAQSLHAEMEYEILKGKYVLKTQVERELSNMLLAFRSRMLALPYRGATLLVNGVKDIHGIEQVLKKLVHEALTELSNYKPEASVAPELNALGNDEAYEASEDDEFDDN